MFSISSGAVLPLQSGDLLLIDMSAGSAVFTIVSGNDFQTVKARRCFTNFSKHTFDENDELQMYAISTSNERIVIQWRTKDKDAEENEDEEERSDVYYVLDEDLNLLGRDIQEIIYGFAANKNFIFTDGIEGVKVLDFSLKLIKQIDITEFDDCECFCVHDLNQFCFLRAIGDECLVVIREMDEEFNSREIFRTMTKYVNITDYSNIRFLANGLIAWWNVDEEQLSMINLKSETSKIIECDDHQNDIAFKLSGQPGVC